MARTNACKYCGKEGLMWVKSNENWRLADLDGEIHDCRTKEVKHYITIQATPKEAEILMFAIDETLFMLKETSNNHKYLTRLKQKLKQWIDEGDE